jgi:predicted Zn-dependent protease
MTLTSLFRITIIAALVAGLQSCAAVQKLEMGLANSMVSPQDEAQLGLQFSQQIEQEVPLLGDEVVDAWLDRVGQELVVHSPPTDQVFTFRATADPAVNAFAIPGGFCYVNAGLILHAENEAEVVAVVAHEVNHVTMRHGVRGMVRAGMIQNAGKALNAAGGDAAMAGRLVLGPGGQLVGLRFGREDEREADYYGVHAMYKAGWDPRGAVTFFEKLNALSGGARSSSMFSALLSTHPPTPERVQNMKNEVAKMDLGRPLRLNSDEWAGIQERVRSLMGSR